MQLTKAEIAETQVIVTTPEKWDVVTRKPTGEGEIASVRPPHNASSKPMTIGYRLLNFLLLMRYIS
jgi:hypothetical protein